jgi:protein-S-isoprenylcysteine O-methyltransferase Ste14
MVFSIFPVENFPSELFGLVFSVLFIFILMIELRILLRNKGKGDDKGSLGFVLIGIFLPLVVVIGLSYVGLGRIGVGLVNYVGLGVFLLGFVLRQWSISILGRFFLPVVKKQKGQRIIKEGPYRFVRHPSYTGLLLELVGVSLTFANWISVIVVLVFFVSAISYRIRIEEEFLNREFSDYGEYKKRTWKLVPFIY